MLDGDPPVAADAFCGGCGWDCDCDDDDDDDDGADTDDGDGSAKCLTVAAYSLIASCFVIFPSDSQASCFF